MIRGTGRAEEVGKQRQPVVSQKWVSQSMSQSRSVAHLARVEGCVKWAGSGSLLAADLTFTLVASCLAAFAHLIPLPTRPSLSQLVSKAQERRCLLVLVERLSSAAISMRSNNINAILFAH